MVTHLRNQPTDVRSRATYTHARARARYTLQIHMRKVRMVSPGHSVVAANTLRALTLRVRVRVRDRYAIARAPTESMKIKLGRMADLQ